MVRTLQNKILEKLKQNKATFSDRVLADNITRANYADFIWADKSVCLRAHFMFHTSRMFNGFSDGKKNKYCHYCYPPFRPTDGVLTTYCYCDIDWETREITCNVCKEKI
jgi:hypothetical protein